MTKFNENHFKAAINMIRVTPENYEKLNAEIIMHLYAIVVSAEKQIKDNPSVFDDITESVYDGKSAEEIAERMKI